MSEGYASRLSEYKNKGVCGLPEVSDSRRQITSKTKQLARLIKEAKHVVVITGAGISTQAGIPDFRGPHGVWTQEQDAKKKTNNNNNKRKRPSSSTTVKNLENFAEAQPTICHRAITKLVALGKVNYCESWKDGMYSTLEVSSRIVDIYIYIIHVEQIV